MFTGAVFLAPGQELRDFRVIQIETRETPNGREVSGKETPAGTIFAILAQAKSEEKERWRQLGHPITHKIIQQGVSAIDIKPGDAFERAGRRFYNQGMPYNIGDLNHWTIYYCAERTDL